MMQDIYGDQTVAENPLKRYFRRPALWVKLPTLGRWYKHGEVDLNQNQEVRIFGLSAVDDVMLNTPDALFNGYALETVLLSCVPDIKDVKSVMQPDLDALFLGIKAATNNGKFDIERKCEACGHDNNFEVQCNHLLDGMTYIEDSETALEIDSELRVHVQPYNFAMRSLLLQKQMEEQRTLNMIERDESIENDIQRADALARSIEKLTTLTFDLVAGAITAIELLGSDNQIVTDQKFIAEWLQNIDKNTATAVIEAVNNLNNIGPPKETDAKCEHCGHTWTEKLNFDPALFFYRPQQPLILI